MAYGISVSSRESLLEPEARSGTGSLGCLAESWLPEASAYLVCVTQEMRLLSLSQTLRQVFLHCLSKSWNAHLHSSSTFRLEITRLPLLLCGTGHLPEPSTRLLIAYAMALFGSNSGGSFGSPSPAHARSPQVVKQSDLQKSDGLPTKAHAHGLTAVTVRTGSFPSQDFLIHKDLLCSASSFFKATLQGSFQESHTNLVNLVDHDPRAFEVLYQFLYTGRLIDAIFFKSTTMHDLEVDVLWLRTLKLADYTLVYELRRAVYARLLSYFTAKEAKVPSFRFIRELYAEDNPLRKLTEYVVAHCSFWIGSGNEAGGNWDNLLLWEPRFAQAVGLQLTRMLVKKPRSYPTHPATDRAFAPEVVCEIPSPANPQMNQVKNTESKKREADPSTTDDRASKQQKPMEQ